MKKHSILFIILCSFLITTKAADFRGDTVDIRSYRINLDLSDFTTKILYGDVTIGLKAKMNNVHSVRLDLLKLLVDTVIVNGNNTPFTYNDSVLNINTIIALNTGDSFTVRVVYHGHPLQIAGDYGGFYWTNSYAFNIGDSYNSDPHNFGKVWFPCFDNFKERSLFEYFVSTKTTHKAFCNGLLLGVTTSGIKKVWHWKLNQEIPSYLASVAVSDFQTLLDTVNGMGGVKEIQLAARASDTTSLKNLFNHLHDAFHIQEGMWGEYVWDRVGYCIVPFTGGAIEHATNIAFSQYYLAVVPQQCETAMAHELSHHWFGDLVTCETAADMWLNEGWARYNEKLFIERFYGDSAYQSLMKINHEDILHTAHVADGSYLPISGVPPQYTFGKTVYDKAADAIHTLRSYMGDALFFSCVKSYLTAYSGQTANTAQMRDYLSTCSGINLTDFFADWIYAPGFPHFSIESSVVQSTLVDTTVNLVIRQQLNHAPHYYNNVPVTVSYFDAQWNRIDEVVMVSGQCTFHNRSFTTFTPVYVALDFDGKLQDAITDAWKVISNIGTYDFGTAKMILTATANVDSSLVRVEHNWVRPEPMQTKIAGLHLHDKRYWTVDGIFNAGFKASARIDYNGTDATLDGSFFINNEDSLVVMYRPNSTTEWAIADSFAINTAGSNTNKIGSATINNLQKGQYCLAIWKASIADTTTAFVDCVYNSVKEISSNTTFQIFPNPTNENVQVSFEKNVFGKAEVFDLAGRKLMEQAIVSEQNAVQLGLQNLSGGAYLVTLTGLSGNRISRTLIKE